jgi:hypothetical protein
MQEVLEFDVSPSLGMNLSRFLMRNLVLIKLAIILSIFLITFAALWKILEIFALLRTSITVKAP